MPVNPATMVVALTRVALRFCRLCRMKRGLDACYSPGPDDLRMMWPIHLVLHLDSSSNRLSPGAARNTVDAANIPTDSNGNNLPGWYSHYTAVGSDWSRIQIVSRSRETPSSAFGLTHRTVKCLLAAILIPGGCFMRHHH